eukprot:TRINITY_DN47828_c0_g1_i1.p1 TRINITY_DN47828_c0_g1~~TRINITY_DN47828_c0_g1_i1.p1  ORF type:complete len:706 (+),score=172.32 TRINITY_DN47828_c0_g1_i1:53-2170(+)
MTEARRRASSPSRAPTSPTSPTSDRQSAARFDARSPSASPTPQRIPSVSQLPRDVKLVLVGDAWPTAAALHDNIIVRVPRDLPLSHSATAIASQLGRRSLDGLKLWKGKGKPPDVRPGSRVKLSQTPDQLRSKGTQVLYIEREPIRVMLCGDAWPCRPRLSDNLYVTCSRAEPLASSQAEFAEVLGCGLDNLAFYRARGRPPDVSRGKQVSLARSADQLDFREKAVLLYVAKADFLPRLEAFYARHDASKVRNAAAVLDAYYGREEELFAKLRRKYGAEPPVAAPVPQAAAHVDPGSDEAGQSLSSPCVMPSSHPGSHGSVLSGGPTATSLPPPGTDRFGFEVDADLLAELDAVRSAEGAAEGRKAVAQELRSGRVDASVMQLLAKWGLEDEDRVVEWSRQCGATAARAVSAETERYASVIDEAQRECAHAAEQIERDLLRTFPGCHRFAEGARMVEALRRVLLAHAAGSITGYCQGLNFIAGALLLTVPEQDVYWILRRITDCEKYMLGYFNQSMENCTLDQRVLTRIVDEQLPGLTDHLARLGLSVTSLSVKWFLCLFIDAAPMETVFRMWDCFLVAGLPVLFRITLALLRKHKGALMEADDIGTALMVMKDATALLTDCGPLLTAAMQEDVSLEQIRRIREAEKEAQAAASAERERRREALRRAREERQQRSPPPEEAEESPSSSPSPRQSLLNLFRSLARR